jgi:hypothetical protein
MQPSALPRQTIAMRQMLLAAIAGFVGGFAVATTAMIWLYSRFGGADDGAWSIVGLIIHCIEIGLFCGLFGACAAMFLIQRRQFPRRHARQVVSRPTNRTRSIRSTFRHQIRTLPAVLGVQLLAVMAGVAVQFVPGRPRSYPFAIDVLLCGALSCIAAAIIAQVLGEFLSHIAAARRLRLRSGVFVQVLVLLNLMLLIVVLLANAVLYR